MTYTNNLTLIYLTYKNNLNFRDEEKFNQNDPPCDSREILSCEKVDVDWKVLLEAEEIELLPKTMKLKRVENVAQGEITFLVLC
jgi:hypothetical protein